MIACCGFGDESRSVSRASFFQPDGVPMTRLKTPEIIYRRPPVQRLEPQLELIAYWMDSAFLVPGLGIRFGFDAIIGLIPGLGDLITSVISLYILAAARRYGVPRATLTRMAFNIGVDTVVGAVPFLGDAFDVFWKANKMNVALLRRHVLSTPEEQRKARRNDTFFIALLIAGLLAVMVALGIAFYVIAQWVVSRVFV
jgi:Domain of unknown function (DUF4112)